MKIVKRFRPKITIFTAVKNRCMLHGRVFVMYNDGLPVSDNIRHYDITRLCHIL